MSKKNCYIHLFEYTRICQGIIEVIKCFFILLSTHPKQIQILCFCKASICKEQYLKHLYCFFMSAAFDPSNNLHNSFEFHVIGHSFKSLSCSFGEKICNAESQKLYTLSRFDNDHTLI